MTILTKNFSAIAWKLIKKKVNLKIAKGRTIVNDVNLSEKLLKV